MNTKNSKESMMSRINNLTGKMYINKFDIKISNANSKIAPYLSIFEKYAYLLTVHNFKSVTHMGERNF